MLTIQFLCPLPNGLHARPAWELKEQCSQWQSEVVFINHRQNARADAKSSLALIGTGTLFNDSCSLSITGRDEEQARRALEEYLQHRFIDSDSVQPTPAELAAHPLPRSLIRLNPDLLYGSVLAGGVGAGTLTLWQSDNLESYRAIAASAEDNTRLEHSLATLAEQLNQQLRERDGESKTILSAHLSLIQDDEFAGNIRRLMLEQHLGLGAAIVANMELVCDKLSASGSDYLRERVSDIRDISEQLLHITWPERRPRNALVLNKPTILVAEDLTPSQFLSLDLQHLSGMILEKTGRTSHTLILARASAIPVLSGLPLAAFNRYSGQHAVLDARCGVLAINPDDAVRGYYAIAQKLADECQRRQALDAAHEYRFVMPIAQFGAAVMPMLTFTGYKKDESFFSLLLQETRRQAVLYPNFLRPMPRLSEPLSPAETQVLRLLCGNRSNQEIADILGVKVATVKTHVIHILQKLGVKRRGDAKEIAQKLHIIEF